jgi:hypothetical protein
MPLIQAILQRDIQEIDKALRMRSALSEVDADGNTVLHVAVGIGDPEIVGLILDKGPEWRENNANETPYDLANILMRNGNVTNRNMIADMVSRYYDATHHQMFIPTTTPAPGCPRQYMRQTKPHDQEENSARLHAALVHHSRKTQAIKSRLVLGEIHANLRQALARMTPPKVGNIVTAAITFELKVVSSEKRHFVTMPIKVPNKSIFTISDTLKLTKGITLQRVLDSLKIMHRTGKEIHGNHTHISSPKYDNSTGDAQLINHSEQPLYYYLTTEDAATMIANRLIAQLRGQDLIPWGEEIKVSKVIAHLHSTKTPCGSCETVIAGEQELNDISNALIKALEKRSFKNAAAEASSRAEPYHFTFPKNGLRLLTTYSADTTDRHTAPTLDVATWRQYGEMSEIELNASIKSNHRFVHVVKFIDKPPASDNDELSEYTVFSSASDINKNVTKRKEEYQLVNNDSLSEFSESMKYIEEVKNAELAKGARRTLLPMFNEGSTSSAPPTQSPACTLYHPAGEVKSNNAHLNVLNNTPENPKKYNYGPTK